MWGRGGGRGGEGEEEEEKEGEEGRRAHVESLWRVCMCGEGGGKGEVERGR